MSELGRCKGALWIRKHKIIKIKGRGYRCKYCDKTYKSLKDEAGGKERERRSRSW